MKTCLYRASNLEPTITFLASFSSFSSSSSTPSDGFTQSVWQQSLHHRPFFIRNVLLLLALAVLCGLK